MGSIFLDEDFNLLYSKNLKINGEEVTLDMFPQSVSVIIYPDYHQFLNHVKYVYCEEKDCPMSKPGLWAYDRESNKWSHLESSIKDLRREIQEVSQVVIQLSELPLGGSENEF